MARQSGTVVLRRWSRRRLGRYGSLPLSVFHLFRSMKHLHGNLFALMSAAQTVLIGRFHKGSEQGMRLQRLGLELRMELAAQEKRMIGNFNDLDIGPVGG